MRVLILGMLAAGLALAGPASSPGGWGSGGCSPAVQFAPTMAFQPVVQHQPAVVVQPDGWFDDTDTAGRTVQYYRRDGHTICGWDQKTNTYRERVAGIWSAPKPPPWETATPKAKAVTKAAPCAGRCPCAASVFGCECAHKACGSAGCKCAPAKTAATANRWRP